MNYIDNYIIVKGYFLHEAECLGVTPAGADITLPVVLSWPAWCLAPQALRGGDALKE